MIAICAPLEAVTTKKVVKNLYDPALLDELVPQLMEKYRIPGVSIAGIENYRVAWDRQYGVCRAGSEEPVVKKTVFEACSMTKPMYAYVAMKLVRKGGVSLDRPLVKYLDKPYIENELLHKKITARMVLSHTTGFPNWREGGWRTGKPLPVLFEPGSKFGYSGEGFFYLQQVIEHITDMPCEAMMRKRLFEPLGMEMSSYVWEDRFQKWAATGHDKNGKIGKKRRQYRCANAGYSLYTTPCEYAIFLVDVMKKGQPTVSIDGQGTQGTVDAMFKPTSKAGVRKPIQRSGKLVSDEVHWGLGWGINHTSLGDRIYHAGTNGGGFQCYHEFDPKRGCGIVIMTNSLSGQKFWKAIIAKVAP